MTRILIDKREKNPLPIPEVMELLDGTDTVRRVTIKKARIQLETGDYALEGSNACLIERKCGAFELWENTCTKDRYRFSRAIERLVEATPKPVLFLEGSPAELERVPPRAPSWYSPIEARDRFLRFCLDTNLTVIWFPATQRVAAARTIVSLLLQAANRQPTIPVPANGTQLCEKPSIAAP